MTFPIDSGRDCARAWEAMPWALQRGHPQEQNEWLENHLAHCESCRLEFAQQSRLRLALSLPSDIPIDANAGLKRLLGRLDMSAAEQEPLPARSANWLTRALVAAVLIQALGIGILGAKLHTGGTPPAYHTLSQESLPVAPGAMHVVPDASMTLADWDALLRSLRLQVIGGPNDVGAYTIVATDPASVAPHALQQLRATPGIRLAEPVASSP